MDQTAPDLIGQAIHDVTCPEGPGCRDRYLHSLGQPLATSGVLARFLARLAELERGEAELADALAGLSDADRAEAEAAIERARRRAPDRSAIARAWANGDPCPQ